MLNNKDFAKLLSQPDSSGKVRFDLNQIKQWDKQNEAQLKKKSFESNSSTKIKSDGNKGQTENVDSSGYRYIDRAEERRKQDSSLDPPQLEQIAATLDYEQSKFLGGDEAHTHLVKGLDFALLRKNREKLPPGMEAVASSSGVTSGGGNSVGMPAESKKSTLKISTLLGHQINQFLFPSAVSTLATTDSRNLTSYQAKVPTAPSSSHRETFPSAPSDTSIKVPAVAQQGFEFDIDPNNANDIPTVVKRSKLEWQEQSDMQYALPATLLKRISSALHLRAQSKLKRKSMEQVQSSAGLSQKPVESVGAVHHSKTTTASADMDIYGDIFEGIGKYEPVGALSTYETSSATTNQTNQALPTQSVKNIFSEVFESSQLFKQPASATASASVSVESRENLSKKSKGSVAGSEVASLYAGLVQSGSGGMPVTDPSSSRDRQTKIIHRDIFLGGTGDDEASRTTNKKVRTAQGDLVLARRGEYQIDEGDDDVMGTFGSDDEDDNDDEADGGAKKKSGKAKSSGGGSSDGPRKSSHPSGLNRAARRALASGSGAMQH